MTLFLAGLATALLIGAGCRVLDLPLPAPPRWQGALLVVAMTAGFLLGSGVDAPGAVTRAPQQEPRRRPSPTAIALDAAVDVPVFPRGLGLFGICIATRLGALSPCPSGGSR